MQVAAYDYPSDGGYADTVATLADGRKLWINTQYKTVDVRHAATCAKEVLTWGADDNVCTMGARRKATACTCGADHGIDDAAIIVDARINGKFGRRPAAAPVAVAAPVKEWRSARGLTLTEEMDREDTIY